VRGGIGTLSEVTLAWSLLQTRSFAKPLVLLGSHWRPVVATFLEHTDLGGSIARLVSVIDTPDQVVIALAKPPTPHSPPPLG
jgi:predicted Rossmann-fold nucleotide-binding protein